MIISTPSKSAADQRGTRSPAASSGMPEEKMWRTAPPTRPRTATITNGTRYQVGRIVASAPIGSVLIAVDSDAEDPASSSPKPSRKIGATAAPNVVHHTTPPPEVRLGR